jgi:hypothetical protein
VACVYWLLDMAHANWSTSVKQVGSLSLENNPCRAARQLRHKYVIVKKSDILTRYPPISFPAATRVLLLPLPLPLPLERSRDWSSSKAKIVKICYFWHPIKLRFLIVFSCSVRIPSLCLLVFLVFSSVISYPNVSQISMS